MSSDEWHQVKAAFEAALDRPQAERRRFLEKTYAPAVVNQVLDLLERDRDDAKEVPSSNKEIGRVFTPGEIVAGRFRVVRQLGSGAIGQVYQVWDEKLSSSLALKTLHPTLSHDPEVLERFRREICVSREVAHPNLCRIFDLVEHHRVSENITCLTMELLNGQNLAQHIRSRRPLAATEALNLLRPMAEALTALHDRGIVHRDLKPSNVMLVLGWRGDPRVVVTDFGLAKPIESGLALFESSAGTVAGTPYFMAPELWDGIRPGVSSDIYALGLIADEMVSKSTAFETGSLLGFYYSKFHEGPIPLSRRSENLSPGWNEAIMRCLDISTASRYNSALEFVRDLERTLEGPDMESTVTNASYTARSPARRVASIKPIVAVLPFSDLSPDRNQGYLCNGLTEELIHLLSQIRSVRVVARASAFQFQNGCFSVQEIVSKLNATYILSGTVRWALERLRVTVQLVDAVDGCNLWSQQFDRKMEDLFAIQEEIAAASMKLLKNELPVERATPAIPTNTNNFEAYNMYLRGLFEFNQQTTHALDAAVACFAGVVAADPGFAPAYVGLADCCCTQEWYGLRPASEVVPTAREYAGRALALNGSLANARCTLALIKARYEWDWDAAEAEFMEALNLDPGLTRAQFCYALDCLTPLGRHDEAERVIHRALELDPLSRLLHTAVGGCLYRRGSYGPAEKSLRSTLAIHPDFYHTHWSMARVLEQLGRYDEAVNEYRAAFRRNPENPMVIAEQGHCYGIMGNRKLAEAAAIRLKGLSAKRYISPLCYAFIHLGLSQRREALDSLEAAADQATGALVWLALDPRLEKIRSEPRLRGILARMKLAG